MKKELYHHSFPGSIQHIGMLDININLEDILEFKAAVKELMYDYSILKS